MLLPTDRIISYPRGHVGQVITAVRTRPNTQRAIDWVMQATELAIQMRLDPAVVWFTGIVATDWFQSDRWLSDYDSIGLPLANGLVMDQLDVRKPQTAEDAATLHVITLATIAGRERFSGELEKRLRKYRPLMRAIHDFMSPVATDSPGNVVRVEDLWRVRRQNRRVWTNLYNVEDLTAEQIRSNIHIPNSEFWTQRIGVPNGPQQRQFVMATPVWEGPSMDNRVIGEGIVGMSLPVRARVRGQMSGRTHSSEWYEVTDHHYVGYVPAHTMERLRD